MICVMLLIFYQIRNIWIYISKQLMVGNGRMEGLDQREEFLLWCLIRIWLPDPSWCLDGDQDLDRWRPEEGLMEQIFPRQLHLWGNTDFCSCWNQYFLRVGFSCLSYECSPQRPCEEHWQDKGNRYTLAFILPVIHTSNQMSACNKVLCARH